MGTTAQYKKEIVNLSRVLPEAELAELADFAQYLKSKTDGFSYSQVEEESAVYVERLRKQTARKAKTSKKFIEELIKWQKSGS